MTVLMSRIMAAVHSVFGGSGLMAGATVGLAISICGQLLKKGAMISVAGAAGSSASAGAILGSIVGGDVTSAFAGSTAGGLSSAIATYLLSHV
jgi:hypothetical protein